MAKYFANIISISRIIATIVLAFMMPLSLEFLVIYSYCGISDMLDGVVARKTHTESENGAFLDSISDIVFLAIATAKLFPMLLDILPRWSLFIGALVAAIRFSAYIVGVVKFRRFATLHTVSNKVAGVALFLIPYMLLFDNVNILIVVVCVLTGISALEELLCEIKAKSYNPDIKSIFEV